MRLPLTKFFLIFRKLYLINQDIGKEKGRIRRGALYLAARQELLQANLANQIRRLIHREEGKNADHDPQTKMLLSSRKVSS